ncbi:unnamed protein product [Cuscuta campestris]|uniref:C2H2-type domain-containing protein n=1 Tax=Cuscuta campestris TaxID=132261 RepID=A0A484N658_9ASTE|nr:unnamed protein product [Cuscuta campestris]
MEISCFQYSSPNCSPEEEDDMAANCLILLAQGGGSHIKAAARKFSDMAAASGAASIDAYLYECKTCNRTFSSFQALGGHRASHKKPKLVMDHQHHDHPHPAATAVRKEIPPSVLAAQACPEKAPKIHECSICGAEFSSGQALGGHMRRHRPVVATNAAAAARDAGAELSLNHDSAPRGGLDLNLPAPQEEEDEEGNSSNNNNNANNKFEFSGKQQSLVFSAPPLVDCHY